MGVPAPTALEISSISTFVTAIQPSVQSLTPCATPQPAEAVRQAVTMISPPGDTAPCAGLHPVVVTGIGDIQRAVEPAPGIVPIHNVGPLRGLVITFLLLGSNRVSTESDFVSLENPVSAHQRQCSLFFHHHHAASPGIGGQLIFSRDWQGEEQHPKSKHLTVHAADYGRPPGAWNATL